MLSALFGKQSNNDTLRCGYTPSLSLALRAEHALSHIIYHKQFTEERPLQIAINGRMTEMAEIGIAGNESA